MKFDELKYHCPTLSIDNASGSVLKLLREAEKLDAGFLVYLLSHSNLLVLAGLRAIGPYNSFSKEMTSSRYNQFKLFLKKHGIDIIQDNERYYTEERPVYSLINSQKISEIPNHYQFLGEKDWPLPVDITTQGLFEWSYVVERQLVNLMEKEVLPKKWLLDWWAPHNLRFGILLGYPGQAISSNLWADAINIENGLETPMSTVNFGSESDLFASVGYYIATDAAKYSEVTRLNELWNGVLETINLEYNEEKLASIVEYKSELKAYKKYENIQ